MSKNAVQQGEEAVYPVVQDYLKALRQSKNLKVRLVTRQANAERASRLFSVMTGRAMNQALKLAEQEGLRYEGGEVSAA